MFIQKQAPSRTEDEDVMFSKKQLLGSCASCDKGPLHINPNDNEHKNWGKFPTRDPTERLARVGQGFSKMISLSKDPNSPKI